MSLIVQHYLTRYSWRQFTDHFSPLGSRQTDESWIGGDLVFIYPGSSYSNEFWVKRSDWDVSFRCVQIEVKFEKYRVHPMLYVPFVDANIWQSNWEQIIKKAKKYAFGTWSLYLACFPLSNDLVTKILNILRYLMFFHNQLSILTPNIQEMRQKLTPLYQLTQY